MKKIRIRELAYTARGYRVAPLQTLLPPLLLGKGASDFTTYAGYRMLLVRLQQELPLPASPVLLSLQNESSFFMSLLSKLKSPGVCLIGHIS